MADAEQMGASGCVEIDGRRLAWRSVGRGPALVLVNGYAATGADWDPELLMRLARSFEVICPDNRGVGASTLGDGPLTIDGMAADLGAMLDALELGRVPVVGWSMGGFIVQRLAAQAPARVASMALLSTDPGGPQAVLSDPSVWAKLIDHSGTPRQRASRLISLLFPPALAPEIDRQFGEVVAAARAALSLDALRAQEAAMNAWHADEQLGPSPEAAPPILVIHGSEDVVIPAANIAPLAARWPGCEIERFAGGHAFMAQEPRRTADLILSFAGALDASDPRLK